MSETWSFKGFLQQSLTTCESTPKWAHLGGNTCESTYEHAKRTSSDVPAMKLLLWHRQSAAPVKKSAPWRCCACCESYTSMPTKWGPQQELCCVCAALCPSIVESPKQQSSRSASSSNACVMGAELLAKGVVPSVDNSSIYNNSGRSLRHEAATTLSFS